MCLAFVCSLVFGAQYYLFISKDELIKNGVIGGTHVVVLSIETCVTIAVVCSDWRLGDAAHD